jgi:hypothetical protein
MGKKKASSPFDDLPGRCCCCGLPTDLFQFGHWWCAICEGRGHNSESWAQELGESHDSSEDCRRLWKNYLEDLANEATGRIRAEAMKDALKAIAGEVDSCGHSHLSTLHDVGKVMRFASAVLAGRDPHEVLQEM